MNYEKISAQQAYQNLEAGNALLVNGYDEPEKWQETQVAGAVPYPDFQQQASATKNREVIFYCNCPNDRTATERAEEYARQGGRNIKVVQGGYDALRKAQSSNVAGMA